MHPCAEHNRNRSSQVFWNGEDLMFDTEIVEVAVRMISTYLLLSVVCWTIGEQVERALNNRVADLDRGLRELLKIQLSPAW